MYFLHHGPVSTVEASKSLCEMKRREIEKSVGSLWSETGWSDDDQVEKRVTSFERLNSCMLQNTEMNCRKERKTNQTRI